MDQFQSPCVFGVASPSARVKSSCLTLLLLDTMVNARNRAQLFCLMRKPKITTCLSYFCHSNVFERYQVQHLPIIFRHTVMAIDPDHVGWFYNVYIIFYHIILWSTACCCKLQEISHCRSSYQVLSQYHYIMCFCRQLEGDFCLGAVQNCPRANLVREALRGFVPEVGLQTIIKWEFP